MDAASLHSSVSSRSSLQEAFFSGKCFRPYFCSSDLNPQKGLTFGPRSVVITGGMGQTVFEQKDILAPSSWSDMAVRIVASKYFSTDEQTGLRESSIPALIERVVGTITAWGRKDGYFVDPLSADVFKAELSYLLLNQYFAFNSPVWFNVGVRENPQCSACFILSVEDTLESLLELQRTEARLFKYGSGAGSNLSSIRSSREKLSGGGIASGPVSFMRGFDAWANTIKSGGKTRRAAKMQILNVNHPDIEEFITCKAREEKKARALIEAGYDASFGAVDGAYDSVSYQNANLSVRVHDEFMQAVLNGTSYWTRSVVDGSPFEEVDAQKIFRLIAESTHDCGDPGLQFDTTINRWHTTPHSGRINASNPCSEYMHVDNSACNLASLNLKKFLADDGSFQVQDFSRAVELLITAQDILIENASYPTEPIRKNAAQFRQLGLGYANLGASLMSLGLAYDSDEGRAWAAAVTSLMSAASYQASVELSKALKPFSAFAKNRRAMLEVLQMHANAHAKLVKSSALEDIVSAGEALWASVQQEAAEYGVRNSQVTVLAPTGTISFMMDCDTTGIEPDISLVKVKRLSDGGILNIVNSSVQSALARFSYTADQQQRILDFLLKENTIEGAPDLHAEHLPIFDCALKPLNGERNIHFSGHLGMMAAVQPFISGAISKTVNLPEETTVLTIEAVYLQAWRQGLKAVALYRDGSKCYQPLASAPKVSSVAPESDLKLGGRRRLPDERRALTHKFSVAGLEGYVTVGLYEDNSPGEIFLRVAKEGSTLSGIMDCYATSISIALQYGVPLKDLARKFLHTRFEPSGMTSNREIPLATSVIDYVFRWLAGHFLCAEEQLELGLKVVSPILLFGTAYGQISEQARTAHLQFSESLEVTYQQADAPPCLNCGSSLMVRQAGCYVCLNCGSQGGCG